MNDKLGLWVRLGDDNGYEFCQDLQEVAFHLVGEDIPTNFDVHPGGISCPGFEGCNYISLFWGDNADQPDKTHALSYDEVDELRTLMKDVVFDDLHIDTLAFLDVPLSQVPPSPGWVSVTESMPADERAEYLQYLSLLNHPTPWAVKYYRRCEEWHPKSSPYIVDANGKTVIDMPQHVGHPGQYDELADGTAIRIVTAINGQP